MPLHKIALSLNYFYEVSMQLFLLLYLVPICAVQWENNFSSHKNKDMRSSIPSSEYKPSKGIWLWFQHCLHSFSLCFQCGPKMSWLRVVICRIASKFYLNHCNFTPRIENYLVCLQELHLLREYTVLAETKSVAFYSITLETQTYSRAWFPCFSDSTYLTLLSLQ